MADHSRPNIALTALFLLTLCLAGSPALAQDISGPPASTGELDVRVWAEGTAGYTTATVALSHGAYTAVFLVEEGAGATLLYPYGPGDPEVLGAGAHRFELSSARLAAHRRLLGSTLSRRSVRRASHRPHTYLLAVAAPTPLRISSLRSGRSFRPAVPTRSALGLADEVMRRVVPDFGGTDWSYHLQPIVLDRVRSAGPLYRRGSRAGHLCSTLLLFPRHTLFTTDTWFLADPWLTNAWLSCAGLHFFTPRPHSPHPRRPPIRDGGESEGFDPGSIRVGHPVPRNLPTVRPRDTGQEGSVEEKTRVRSPRVAPPRMRTPRVVPSRVQPPRVRPNSEASTPRARGVSPRVQKPVKARPRVQKPVKPPRVQKPAKPQPRKVRPKKKPPEKDGEQD